LSGAAGRSGVLAPTASVSRFSTMAKALLILALGLAGGLAIIGLRNRHRFRYRPTALTLAAVDALARAHGFERIEAAGTMGARLVGLARRPAAAGAPWLLFFPGNGPDLLGGSAALLQGIRGEEDFGLVVFGYRGFDASSGDPDAARIYDDAELVHEHARGMGAAPDRIHLVAFSLGTAVALQLAERLAAAGRPCASITLLSPYDEINVVRPRWYDLWLPGDSYRALDFVGRGRSPVLLIHGARDDAVPVAAGRRMAAALGSRAQFVELVDRGHADYLGDPETWRRVRQFVLSPPR
jgi:pimeloyl-ACP methyl ester carboxylesterase